MAVTIALPPDAGEWLERAASREGESLESVAVTLLVERMAWEGRDY